MTKKTKRMGRTQDQVDQEGWDVHKGALIHLLLDAGFACKWVRTQASRWEREVYHKHHRSHTQVNVALIEHAFVLTSYNCRKHKQAGAAITNTDVLLFFVAPCRLFDCRRMGADYAIILGRIMPSSRDAADYGIIRAGIIPLSASILCVASLVVEGFKVSLSG